MDKLNKNIIEAGVTPAEFEALFADDITQAEYLNAFPLQSHRYGHLADLAGLRGDDVLQAYFFDLSGLPLVVDSCD